MFRTLRTWRAWSSPSISDVLGFESSEIYLATLPRRPVQVTHPGLDRGAASSTGCLPRDLLKMVYRLLRHVCALFHGRDSGMGVTPEAPPTHSQRIGARSRRTLAASSSEMCYDAPRQPTRERERTRSGPSASDSPWEPVSFTAPWIEQQPAPHAR